MPRFYFHLHEEFAVPDVEGRELADEAAARAAAIREARDLAGENVKQGQLNLSYHIRVTDAQRQLLFDVRFGEVVTVIQ